MKKNIKNFTLENNINKNYFKNNSYLKDKIRINKIIKKTYENIDDEKNNFHVLSKKFIFDFDKNNFKNFTKYKTIIIIGMGGSVLGAHSIYSFLKKKVNKNFIFIDNLDQEKIEDLNKKKNFESSFFIIISKSGNTIETLINSNLFKDKINSKNSIIITEEEKNLLNIFAKKKKYFTSITKSISAVDILFYLRLESCLHILWV